MLYESYVKRMVFLRKYLWLVVLVGLLVLCSVTGLCVSAVSGIIENMTAEDTTNEDTVNTEEEIEPTDEETEPGGRYR